VSSEAERERRRRRMKLSSGRGRHGNDNGGHFRVRRKVPDFAAREENGGRYQGGKGA